jgi:hypothetical protein
LLVESSVIVIETALGCDHRVCAVTTGSDRDAAIAGLFLKPWIIAAFESLR